MTFNREDPTTWPMFRPTIIAHDVGRSHDRSTAVVGGLGPFEPTLLGVTEFEELPQNQFGSARASALAVIDRRYYSNALIVADLSNDASYADNLLETFGARVIGLQIGRHGNGMEFERRPVKGSAILVYQIGRRGLRGFVSCCSFAASFCKAPQWACISSVTGASRGHHFSLPWPVCSARAGTARRGKTTPAIGSRSAAVIGHGGSTRCR
jgi:hypothetical protein